MGWEWGKQDKAEFRKNRSGVFKSKVSAHFFVYKSGLRLRLGIMQKSIPILSSSHVCFFLKIPFGLFFLSPPLCFPSSQFKWVETLHPTVRSSVTQTDIRGLSENFARNLKNILQLGLILTSMSLQHSSNNLVWEVSAIRDSICVATALCGFRL